jgi:ABC-type branched-subunit amino acid transport system ATPase component
MRKWRISAEVAGAEPILELRHISAAFPEVRALDDVNLRVKRGDIHAIVGENLSGKTTLMKIIGGHHPSGSYTGEILVDGTPQRFNGIRDSEKAGIGAIYHEMSLVEQLSVSENLFLGNEISRRGIIKWTETRNQSRIALQEVGLDIDPGMLIFNLGVVQHLLIEIAKAILKSQRILVLDEPSALLSRKDNENLFRILRRLKSRGITCLYATEKPYEALEIADTITVMREGKVVVTRELKEVSAVELRAMIDGQAQRRGPQGPAGAESAGMSPAIPAHFAEDGIPMLRNLAVEPVQTVAPQLLGLRSLLAEREGRNHFLKRIAIKKDSVFQIHKTAEIDFIRVENGLVLVHCNGASNVIDTPLNALEEQLDPETFFRAHRNAIVNLSRVSKVIPWGRGAYVLELAGGERIGLSRHRIADFKRLMGMDV